MRKVLPVMIAAILLLLSACGGPKNYEDCTGEQKLVLRCARVFAGSGAAAGNVSMDGDAILITDTNWTKYEFIPVSIDENGTERKEVAMFKSEKFIGFASDEAPLCDVLNYESLSELRQREVTDFAACSSVWRCYDDYGEKSVGRNAGSEDWILQIWTIETIERSEIEYLFNRWTNPA